MEQDGSKDSQVKIRLASDLRNWLKREAIANHRSLLGEIAMRLAESRVRQLATQKTAAGEAACSQAKPMN